MKELSYKKKNKLLLTGIVFFALIVYNFSIKNTLVAYSKYNQQKELNKSISGLPSKLKHLNTQLDIIDRKLQGTGFIDLNFQQQLLTEVTDHCKKEKIILKEFPRVLTSTRNEFIIETNQFTAEGNFKSLLGLVYSLEQSKGNGRVASIHFVSRENLKTKRPELTAKVFVQNVRKPNSSDSKI